VPKKPAPPRTSSASNLRKRSRSGPRTSARAVDAAFRLDGSLVAQVYRLHIDVDPAHSPHFRGHLELEATLTEARDHVELHAAELDILSAQVQSLKDPGDTLRAGIQLHPESETLALHLDSTLPPGPVRIELEFAGQLRGDLRGLYAAAVGGSKYAFTQLQAADARRFFPCLDEPDQKASFELCVHTAAEHEVISNSPIARIDESASEHGYKTVVFEPTPRMSSYLVALAVGDLVCSEAVLADGVPIRVVHARAQSPTTEFALETARECLTRLSRYFALPYPYKKLDLVAVPDFEIGAMENAGAVFFRETLLLVDEASVSSAEKKRAAEVICHELAHMWYGNLVTMRWWDDLWLNEAFATWMAFDIVAKWRPEWQMWNDFCHGQNAALSLDALANTHPIYTAVSTPSEATENFDLITYEKGASVVRMIERYLGPKVFQRGVQRYIKRHREGNTVAADLWRALSEAAGENVETVVSPFIERPGFPLLRIARKQRAGRDSLHFQQERFYARGPGGSGARGSAQAADEPAWPLPWVGQLGVGSARAPRRKPLRHLVKKLKDRLPIAQPKLRYIYGNADEGGFFRPLHDPRDLPALFDALPELSVTERLGFVQHQWALVRAGYAQLTEFLPLLAALSDEPEAAVLRTLIGPIEHLLEDLARSLGAQAHAALRGHLLATFGPAFDALGWDGAPDEPDVVRLRRSELAQIVAVLAESESHGEPAEARFQAYMRERSTLDPNLIAPVLSLAARRADASRLSQLLEASQQDKTPQGQRRFRLACADVRAPELAHSVLAACLTPKIPTQDVAFVVARLLRNPHVQEIAFEFMQARWSELRERIPAMLVSRLIEATPALRTEACRRQLHTFFSAHPLPTAARALRQADERFRLDAAFRKRATKDLRAFLRTLS